MPPRRLNSQFSVIFMVRSQVNPQSFVICYLLDRVILPDNIGVGESGPFIVHQVIEGQSYLMGGIIE